MGKNKIQKKTAANCFSNMLSEKGIVKLHQIIFLNVYFLDKYIIQRYT